MGEELYGIQNIKEVAVFLAKGVVTGIQTAGGEELSIDKVLALLPAATAAVKDYDQIDKEWKDAHPAEIQEVTVAVIAELQPLGVIQPEMSDRIISAAGHLVAAGFDLAAIVELAKAAKKNQ